MNIFPSCLKKTFCVNHDFSCNKTMKHSSNANIKQFANYLTSTPHKFVPVLALEPFSL